LPVGVIASMLGVADGDLAMFKKWSDAIIQNVAVALFNPDNNDLEEINREFDAYFSTHIEKLRAHPEDTLLSALVHAVGENGETLSLEDLLVVSRVLLVAAMRRRRGSL
jgi:cytochrome P450